MSTETALEAILFYRGEPEKRSYLQKLLNITEEELEEGLQSLASSLQTRGIRLLLVNDEVELVSAPETSELISTLRKDELTRDLGKAGAETLAIILYHGPASRAHIDYIRGVSSNFILRNLLIRGLIERISNPENTRSVLYRATPSLLAHLGVTTLDELPEYAQIREALQQHTTIISTTATPTEA